MSTRIGVTGTARYFWSPNSVKIAPGGSVTFSWSGDAAHDLSVPGLGYEAPAKAQFSETLVFTNPGDYAIICIIHLEMRGKVIVQ